MSETITCYRFVTDDLRSQNGDEQWVIGKWKKVKGSIRLCEHGLHGCKTPTQSLNNILGTRWFKAEARGTIIEGEDKFCASQMRLVKEIPQSVIHQWMVDCAYRTLPIYENQYPEDKRPRKALEAKQAWINNPCEETAAAARAAEAAAWAAAETATEAAWAAAGAAGGAAAWAAARADLVAAGGADDWAAAWAAADWIAARAAERAVGAAERAAWAAARASGAAAGGAAAWAAARASEAAEKAAGAAADWAAAGATERADWAAAWAAERKWQQKHLNELISLLS